MRWECSTEALGIVTGTDRFIRCNCASVRLDTNFRCRYVLLRDPEVTELHGGNNCFLSYIVISLLIVSICFENALV